MVKELKKENKKIDIKSAITLCNITDEYERFSKELRELMSKGNSDINIYRLYRISIGEKIKNVKENKDIIKFYLQNEETIKKIKSNFSVNDFIFNNYSQEGNISDNTCIKELYEYLIEHKDKKDEILKLFYKLKDLGFSTIIFDQNLDFTNDKYSINNNFNRNQEVVYLDNMEIIPNYDFGTVEYKSKDSNYKIILKTLCFDFSRSDRTIALNSLLFDTDKLPKMINKETLFDSIIELKEEQKEKYKKITNSINFSVQLDDFSEAFLLLNNAVEKLDTITNIKEIKDVLCSIKNQIEELKGKSREFDTNLVKEKNITLESLKNQKSLVLELRKWKKEDCC